VLIVANCITDNFPDITLKWVSLLTRGIPWHVSAEFISDNNECKEDGFICNGNILQSLLFDVRNVTPSLIPSHKTKIKIITLGKNKS
jgi:hypothetical protein